MSEPLDLLPWPPSEGRLERRQAEVASERTMFELIKGHLGPNVEGSDQGPDLLLHGASGELSLAIELKIWRHSVKNLQNRVAETLSQSVRLWRMLPRGVRTGLVVVLLGEPTTNWTTPSAGMARAYMSIAELIRRGPTDAGYDRVIVGLKGSTTMWGEVLASGEYRPAGSFGDAVRRLNEPAEHEWGQPPELEGDESLEAVAPERPPRILLVASEWLSSRGGISTFNRELAVAFARAGCEMHVAVPSATHEERDMALAQGVTLVTPDPVPGIEDKALLLTPPRFPDKDYSPDLIVGHGRVLGPYAYAMQAHFKDARRLHVVHMDAERLEAVKARLDGIPAMVVAERRSKLELDLAVSADLVAGVGPLLAESISEAMRGLRRDTPNVVELRPGLRDWDGIVDGNDPPTRRQVLLVARAEDIESKGIDIAARALVRAVDRFEHDPGDAPALVVRGVPPELHDQVRLRLEGISEPNVRIILRPFSTDEDELRRDLWQSRLVVMPSRHEGFGLVAHEAIAAGVPVLVSRESGIGRMLRLVVDDADRLEPREVLPVAGEDNEIADIWGDRIYETLIDPRAAYAHAADVREQLLQKTSWYSTIRELLEALEIAVRTGSGGG